MTSPWEPTGRTVHLVDADGCIRDWLVGPEWVWPCPPEDLAELVAADGSPWGPHGRWVLTNGPDVAPLKQALYARHPLVTDRPDGALVENGPLERRTHDGRLRDGRWRRYRTGADGLVDRSRFCYTPEYSEALAATVIEVDQPEWRVVEVACTGPFVLWIGNEQVADESTVGYMEPVVHRYPWRFTSGSTELLIAGWQVALREVRQVLRVRVDGLPVRVVIPSPGADEFAAAAAESVLESVAVTRWAIGPGDAAELTGPAGVALRAELDDGSVRHLRLDDSGRGRVDLVAGDPGAETPASMLTTSECRFRVTVDDPACPVAREYAVGVLPGRHRAHAGAGDPSVWSREVWEHALAGSPGTARALARHTLQPGTPLDATDLQPALTMIDGRADCADFEAVGLMNLWHRVPEHLWPAGSRERLRTSMLAFKYWIDQPGLDAMCYFTENHQFVWHTAEILAGEAFPDAVFGNGAMTGREHSAHGRELARQWLSRKLAGGFSEFDSNAYLAIDSLALVSLVEHAQDTGLRRSAEALLDKILLTLAANSWRGIHGSAHGRSYTPTLRSARFEETAPIMWALWGVGTLNNAVLPVTVLTTSRVYRMPEVIRSIATDLPESWQGRQVYRGRYRLHHDLLERPYGSDVHCWRTPDGMLSSVQDYRPGLPGLQEHIWGATLSAEVQVFATAPSTDSISPSARPNAWAGQRILPRVRQFGDAVLAVHRLPADASFGTHLWFPAPLMDETAQRGSWLAGRVADGYVAVAAAGGWQMITTGDGAHQSFRPVGDGRAQVCTLGRRATDGPFAAFVNSLTDPEFDTDLAGTEPAVRWRTRDGRQLALGWRSAPTVDGRPVDLADDGTPRRPPHLSNPACHSAFGDPELSVEWSGERLVIDLAAGRRLVPDSRVSGSENEPGGRR